MTVERRALEVVRCRRASVKLCRLEELNSSYWQMTSSSGAVFETYFLLPRVGGVCVYEVGMKFKFQIFCLEKKTAVGNRRGPVVVGSQSVESEQWLHFKHRGMRTCVFFE